MERQAVVLTRLGDNVGAWMTLKVVAITLPITVEPERPGPRSREADDVAILRLMQKVGNDHDVVRRPTLVPTVESDNIAFFIHVVDLGELPAEAAREAVAVEPQPDEIAV